MAVYREDGALLSPHEPLRWGCGRILRKSGKNFPVLYSLACAKDASIAPNLEFLGGSNQ